MIVSPFYLLDVQQELSWTHTMMLCHVLFCKTPKSFYPINVHITFSKHLAVINGQMFVAVENQRVISFPLVRVHDISFLDFSDGACKKCLCFDIVYNLNMHFFISLQYPKDNSFVLGTASRFPFLLPPK